MIKYICKTSQLKLSNNRIIENPVVKPVSYISLINYNQLRIDFQMTIKNENDNDEIVSEGKGSIQFGQQNIETLVNHNGTEKEIVQAINDGWTFNPTEITKLGTPSSEKVRRDYIKENNDGTLEYKQNAFTNLAKAYIGLKVIIDGKPLSENFDLIEQ